MKLELFEESETLDKLINNFSNEVKHYNKKLLNNFSQKLFNVSMEIDTIIKSNDEEVNKLDF